MWDDAPAARPAETRNGLSIRYNEDLDPNEGPGFGCFVTQAILFALILLLIPVGLFAFSWPVWLLATLLVIDLILLFFVSMTSVFLLRVFFADRRRGRGRQAGVARTPTRVITTDEPPAEHGSPEEIDGR
jgi:membrane protein implicated in regulation of membrane protease activity